MSSRVNVVLGAGQFGYKDTLGMEYADKTQVPDILNVFKKYGGSEIDNSRIYGGGTSETLLGELDYEAQGFKMDTKVPPGVGSAEAVHSSIKESLKQLRTSKVHILYLHAPDRTTPFEETLRAVNEEYKKGRFERFGLSNFSVDDVEQILEITTKNEFVKPSAYEGLYNVVARAPEEKLFPLLKKHGISFYAYSPLAGSFLVDSDPAKNMRFNPDTQIGQITRGWFFKDSYFKGLEKLQNAARKLGLSLPDVAFRWLNHHSQLNHANGDAVIIGGKSSANTERSLVSMRNPPLPEEMLRVIEEVWELIKADAAPYHV